MKYLSEKILVVVLTLLIFLSTASFCFAMSSTNYEMKVSNLAPAGGESNSSSYNLSSTVGDFVSGIFSSVNYQIQAGYMYFKKPNKPQAGYGEALSSSSIRWYFTDKSQDEEGFGLKDESGNSVLTQYGPNKIYLDESGLSENTKYTRFVYAYNSFGQNTSNSSMSKYTLVGSPTGFYAVPTTTSMTLYVNSFPNDSVGSSGYYFYRSEGGVDVENSGWQSGVNSWLDDGLSVNTQYSYYVKQRNGDGVESGEASLAKYTLANVPGQPLLKEHYEDKGNLYCDIKIIPNSNPSYTEFALFMNDKYVQGDGSVSDIPYWSTSLNRQVKNLEKGTTYTFRAKARNGDGIETDFSSSASTATPGKKAISHPKEKESTRIEKIIKTILDNIRALANRIAKFLRSLWSNPLVQAINKLGIVPALAIAALANLLAAIPLASFFPFLVYLWQVITEPFYLLAGKRRKPWGAVYNSLTKQPVDLAIVRLFDSNTQKLIQTRVTDREGRFGFLVDPGSYYIQVTKQDFTFPSNKLNHQPNDLVYTDLYYGETLTIGSQESKELQQDPEMNSGRSKDAFINVNIPLDPVTQTKELFPYKKAISNYLRKKLSKNIAYIGPIIALICLIVSPGIYTAIFLAIHIILLITFKRLALSRERIRPWGMVYDALTKRPIGMAVVRINDQKYQNILETQITDNKGRFGFLVGPSEYYLTAEKEGYTFPLAQKHEPLDYIGGTIKPRTQKGIVNVDVPMERTRIHADLNADKRR